MNLNSENLKPESLEWAKLHIDRFGDTDLLPFPFEYKAIGASWPKVKGKLLSTDLATWETGALRHFLVPKPTGGFRVTTQLDPLDALLYTAIVYEIAEEIERSRPKQDLRVACSYRVELKPDGQLFRRETGWTDFDAKSKELVFSADCHYVVNADISDFYNQISHHRVENALESAGISQNLSRTVERLLGCWTAGQSRGIPVGPHASIILAEACLTDVDKFLLSNGFNFTRYVDDFRIFCASLKEAQKALHELSAYLYRSHRLALQGGKTRIQTVERFIEDLEDPAKLEETAKSTRLAALLEEASADSLYSSTETVMEDEVELDVAREALVELFNFSLAQEPLRLGLTRYVLKRAAYLRIAALQEPILDNLERLGPVLPEIVRYLTKIPTKHLHPNAANRMLWLISSSPVDFMPFVREWVAYFFSQIDETTCTTKAFALFDRDPESGARRCALLVRKLQDTSWPRNRKEIWRNYGPWDRRAVILSASALPSDERKHWLKNPAKSDDLLDYCQAIAAASF